MNNDILEEEVEIIEIFNSELKAFGHEGYCSFYENVDNGYFIYKDNGAWMVCFNKKGETVYRKKYTNIYNLCLDVLSELKMDDFYFKKRDLRIPRGTRVIITKSTDCPIDEINKGVIINSSLEARDHGMPERIYQVFGDDGVVYTGLYGLKIYGDICFRTMEDYIADIDKQIAENSEAIRVMKDINWDLYLKGQEIIGEKDRFLEDRGFTK